MNGPVAGYVANGFGLQHVLPVDENIRLDYVPVDLTVKGMIVAAWTTWKDEIDEIPIYNASSIKNTSLVSFRNSDVIQKSPPLMAIMYQSVSITKCTFYAWIVRILESLIPAMIIDGLLMMLGRKPQ